MRKKRAPVPRPQQALDDPSEFARAVRAALGIERTGSSLQTDLDVREVADGLAALRQMIDAKRASLKLAGDEQAFAREGILKANKIFEALTTGRDHQIWKFIQGMQSADFRPGRPRPTIADRAVRIVWVQVTRAYSQAAGIGHEPAISKVLEAYSNIENKPTVAQIVGWNARLLAEEDIDRRKAGQDFIDQANAVGGDASIPDRILQLGRRYLGAFGAAPTVPSVASGAVNFKPSYIVTMTLAGRAPTIPPPSCARLMNFNRPHLLKR